MSFLSLEILFWISFAVPLLGCGVYKMKGNKITLSSQEKGCRQIPDNIWSNVTSINLRKNKISKIPSGVFSHLDNLTTINLYSNSIVYLMNESFQGVYNLVDLDLGANHIENLSNVVPFIPSSVATLRLRWNKFYFVPDFIFSHLIHLRYLDLSRKNTVLGMMYEPMAFFNLNSLKSLSMQEAPIANHTLPNELFSPLKKLKLIHLDKTDLEIIPNFTENGNLEKIYLVDNMMTEIPTETWGSLPALTRINISSNNIKHLGKIRIPSLWEFSANGNNLSNISDDVFSDLNLRYLYLNNCSLSKIPNISASANSMKTLLLNRNNINLIPVDTLSGFSKLEHLDISDNLLSEFPDHLETADKLHTLNVGGNRLEIFPDILDRFPYLGFLNLSHNAMNICPNVTSVGHRIREIHLENNKLVDSKCSEFFLHLMPQLTYLNISVNFLTTLPPLDNFPALEYIIFSHNLLTTIPPSWEIQNKNMSNPCQLRKISLRHNSVSKLLSTVIEMFSWCGVTELDLGENKISEVPALWLLNETLEALFLDNNLLTNSRKISPEKFQMMKLTFLNISHNMITSVAPTFFVGFPTLEVFDISYNKLSSFPGEQVEQILSQREANMDVFLSGNSFVCDTGYCWIFDAMNLNIVFEMGDTPCTKPGRLAATPWELITSIAIGCSGITRL